MGFSVLDSSWSFRLYPKMSSPSLTPKRDPICLNMRFGHPIRAYSARVLKCRSVVSEDFVERSSPSEVKKELEICFDLIHRLGRGILYLGSARIPPNHSHYIQAQELSREAANLLDCTTWSGAGPGLMDAVTKGALEAKKPVGGIKIEKEAGEWTASKFHPYLPPQNYHTCRFFSARKHGLVDAVMRNNVSDKTAVIALPGGVGTLDEMFEILALIQLKRIGSVLPVPFIVMNYDSFYSKLLEFIETCENLGTVSKREVSALWKVCNNNFEALTYLAEFYDLPYGSTKLETELGKSSRR
ncbi:PREDICTED: probable cytokinin riboside 5'-monophosphate phosphoribohydrolase LOGL10 [Camelina sativa]|uniref:Probable cytokinin riboside 5'-monophosphate phosphoribohydrolase LOGL10 n=1 Tax=Camelina sativa TaxID=90675 RepID=A0ABM0VW23_CAMSA|nr:PREDICTED: probable cytokinin riboside 5'-monophosphate phosphoribohydrolase LOGL10 [Camelina sativa]